MSIILLFRLVLSIIYIIFIISYRHMSACAIIWKWMTKTHARSVFSLSMENWRLHFVKSPSHTLPKKEQLKEKVIVKFSTIFSSLSFVLLLIPHSSLFGVWVFIEQRAKWRKSACKGCAFNPQTQRSDPIRFSRMHRIGFPWVDGLCTYVGPFF